MYFKTRIYRSCFWKFCHCNCANRTSNFSTFPGNSDYRQFFSTKLLVVNQGRVGENFVVSNYQFSILIKITRKNARNFSFGLLGFKNFQLGLRNFQLFLGKVKIHNPGRRRATYISFICVNIFFNEMLTPLLPC